MRKEKEREKITQHIRFATTVNAFFCCISMRAKRESEKKSYFIYEVYASRSDRKLSTTRLVVKRVLPSFELKPEKSGALVS